MQEPTPWTRRDALAVAGLLALFVAVAVIFFVPWRPPAEPGSPDLRRYLPLRNGDAALAVLYDAAGQAIGWQSTNASVVPSLSIFTELPVAPRRVIDQRYFGDGTDGQDAEDMLAALADVRVVQVHLHTLRQDGTVARQDGILLRDGTGQYLAYLEDKASGLALTYDPLVQTLPSVLQPGVTWQGRGRVNDSLDYTVSGRVVDLGPFGQHRDCARIEVRHTITGEGVTIDSTSEERYCAGIGLVESRARLADGAGERSALVSTGDLSPNPALLPPASALAAAGQQSGRLAAADLARFARVLPEGFAGGGTMPPSWLATEPPLLLAAGYNGDLVAFAEIGNEVWRFDPGGTIHGAVGVDASSGRLYVGASDKRLTALDGRGLFLWSYATGDNVATRPLVAGEVVVFGSEDRTIYGLDRQTGDLRWRVATGAAVTSSPAAIGDLVAIGSDDGVVYGLDTASGAVRWTYVTGGPVEADVVAADGHFYVASRDGALAAVDPLSGEEIWSTVVGPGEGTVLRTPPTVAGDRLFVVDTGGLLYAVDGHTGRRMWQTGELGAYRGPPLAVQDGVLLARGDGAIDLLDGQGQLVRQWDANSLRVAGEPPVTFALGPSQGSGAVWLVDNNAVIYRLAPKAAGLTSNLPGARVGASAAGAEDTAPTESAETGARGQEKP